MRNSTIGLALVTTLLMGCGQPPATTETPVAQATSLAETPAEVGTPEAAPAADEATVKLAEQLGQKIADGKLEYKEKNEKSNGPGFLYLASTSEDPKVLAEALDGMSKTYSSYTRSDKRNPVDEAYVATVSKHLASEDKAVRYWALQAAGQALIENPDSGPIASLNKIASDDKELGARYEALESLAKNRDWDKSDETVQVFLKALEDEPAVISIALFRLEGKVRSISSKEEFASRTRALLKHQDPGVRGRATKISTQVVADDGQAELASELEGMLKDENAFVRSEAAEALAHLRHLSSTEKIVALLDDHEKNTYDIKFDNLLGRKDTVHHDGSAWSRVDDSALHALETMSVRLGDKKFTYAKIDYKKVDEDIAREVKRAKDWFKANQAELAKG